MSTVHLPPDVVRTKHDADNGIQHFQFYAYTSNVRTPGLKVVIKNSPSDIQGSAAFFNLLVDCGSRNENLDQLGGAHLLEHACFLGLGGEPLGDVQEYFWTRQGARDNNNAFTTVNAINYSAETEMEHYDNLLNTFTKMLSGANLQNLENNRYFKQEQQNVVSEHRRNNNAAESARRTMVAATSMVNSALGLHNARPTIGSERVYTAMTPDDLRALHRQCFCPSRATLVVCGLQDTDGTFLEKVHATLGKVPINTAKAPLQAPMPTMRLDMSTGQRMKIIQSGNAATYLAFATAYPDMVQGSASDRLTSFAKRITLDVLHELLLPSKEGQQGSGLLQDLFTSNFVYQGVIMPAQSGYASPSVMLMAVPSDKQSEAQRVFAVQAKVQEILSYVLPKFSQLNNATKMLADAKQRVIDNDSNMANGTLRGISDALLQGVRYRNSDYFFNRHQHVAKVTPHMIEEVAKTVWSPDRLSIVVHSQHDKTFNDPGSDTTFNFDTVAKFQTRAAAKLDTDSYYCSKVSQLGQFMIQNSVQKPSKNCIECTRTIKPDYLAEVRLTYSNLAQGIDNYEESKVMAEAVNRYVNKEITQRLPADANVQISAMPTALGFHVFVRAHQNYINTAVHEIKRRLTNASEDKIQTEVANLIASHVALLNGDKSTNAHAIAQELLAKQVFSSPTLGFTIPSYNNRQQQLQALQVHENMMNVVKKIKNLAAHGQATCFATLNTSTAQEVQAVQGTSVAVYQNYAADGGSTNTIPSSTAAVKSSNTNSGTNIVKVIQQHFAPSGITKPLQDSRPFPLRQSPHEKFVARDIPNTQEIMYHMWVMLPNVSIGDMQTNMATRVSCEIFAQTLGNGFGGDMMKTLRGEHGLTYGTTVNLELGSMLNLSAHPILQCTATFKPPDFNKGVELMTQVIHDAMVGPQSVTQHKLAEAKFNIAQNSLKTSYTRYSTTRNTVMNLMLSHQLLDTDHDTRAALCGVSFGTTDKKPLLFSAYCAEMERILPASAEEINIYGAAVGTGATDLMQSYLKSRTDVLAPAPARALNASMANNNAHDLNCVKLRL